MFGTPGLAVKSSISLLSRMPVPPATQLGAEPVVQRVGHRDRVALACRRSNSASSRLPLGRLLPGPSSLEASARSGSIVARIFAA